jgi:cytidylate kinase
MYRAVTFAGLRAGIDLQDEQALGQLLVGMRLELTGGRVLLNGEDVTYAIRGAEVTAASRYTADSPTVRRQLVRWQQEFAVGRDIVTEGRDQGTLVFPHAACKFFVVADPVARAKRRQKDMAARGENLSLEQVLQAQEQRDQRDEARALAPMVPAPDAIHFDTTDLSLDQVVEQMEQIVRGRQ